MTRENRLLDLRTLLLMALVGSTALLPPELNPSGLALAATLSAGLGVLLLFPAGPAPRIPRAWRAPVWTLLAYLCLALITSPQPHRSVAFVLGGGMSLVAFAAASKVSESQEGELGVSSALAALGALVGCWGIYQRAFGLADTARRLRELGQRELDPQILRAESGRAFGGFLLPSSLGIYMAMSIPLTLRLGFRSRWRGWGGLLAGGAIALQVAGLGASVSYGAVASLAIASGILLIRTGTRGRERSLGLLALAAAAMGAAFLAIRPGEGASPLLLRAGNWEAAWRVLLSRPFLGAGFRNFSDAYPGVMTPGMNETAYVHNSYLQIAAEGGVLAMAWLAFGLAHLLARLLPRSWSREEGAAPLLAAVAPLAFLVHNLFDFSAYLPSLSITFAIAAGLAMGAGQTALSEVRSEPSRWVPLPRAALLCLLLGGAAWNLRESLTRWDLEQGRELSTAGRREEGMNLLRRAARRDPLDPDPPAVLAEMELSESENSPALRIDGERYARLSVELRPERAYGHYVLAMFRLAAGDRGEAWSEMARARRLYPTRDLYAREEARLREIISTRPEARTDSDAPR
jgi:hypothetical protein